MPVIYKATNKINGKSYIGFASKFEVRKQKHLSDSKREKKTHYFFHKAIKKYGWDNFEWSVLKEDATLEDERHFIKEHDTFGNGYNLTTGGDGNYEVSEHTRKRISIGNKGKKYSLETKLKMSKAKKGNKYCLGYRHTEEAKIKIRQYQAERKRQALESIK